MNVKTARLFACLATIICIAAGCATSRESDLPWNTPATWEGSPYIPGFSE